MAARLAVIFLFVLGWTYYSALPALLTAQMHITEAESAPRRAESPPKKGKKGEKIETSPFFLGSNSFHHHALEHIRKLKRPPVLVLIDAHSDARPGGDKLNCGNWVRHAQEAGVIKKTIWLGGALGISGECGAWFSYESLSSGRFFPFPAGSCRAYFKTDSLQGAEYAKEERRDNIGAFFGFPGMSVSWRSWREALALGFLKNIVGKDEIYISLDLDVLRKDIAPTVWGNGLMSMGELKEMLDYLNANFRITGFDICGPPEAAEEVMAYAEKF